MDIPVFFAAVLTLSVGSELGDADFNETSFDTTTEKYSEYVIVNVNEYSRMYTAGNTIIVGMLDGYVVFKDLNGTKYILIPVTYKQREKELKEQLADKNHTGPICTAGACFDRERAEEYLKELEDFNSKRLSSYQIPTFVGLVTVVCLVGIVGITGNVLIIVGVFKSKKMRNSTSVLICSLATSDILVLGFCLPLQVQSKFYTVAPQTSVHLCRFWVLLKHFSIVVSSFTMATMAVERYIAVCHPLHAKSYCTVRNARYAVIFVWLLAFSITSPVMLMVQPRLGALCVPVLGTFRMALIYSSLMLVIVFGIPALIMGPLYSRVFYVLWRSSKKLKLLRNKEESANDAKQDDSIKSRKQVIKMLAVILILFLLTWGPPTIFDTVDRIHNVVLRKKRWSWSGTVSFAFETLGFCNSFFNPLAYILMSRQFREYLASLKPCQRSKIRHGQQPSSASDTSGTVSTDVRNK